MNLDNLVFGLTFRAFIYLRKDWPRNDFNPVNGIKGKMAAATARKVKRVVRWPSVRFNAIVFHRRLLFVSPRALALAQSV